MLFVYKKVYKGEIDGDYKLMKEDGSVEDFDLWGALTNLRKEIEDRKKALRSKEKLYLSFKPPHDVELSQGKTYECKPLDKEEIDFILENL